IERCARRVGDETVMQRLLPARLELIAKDLRPCRAHERLCGRIDHSPEHGDDLRQRASAVERTNERLNDCRRSIYCTRVVPAFERMGQRQMPMAVQRGLIMIKARVNARGNSLEQL